MRWAEAAVLAVYFATLAILAIYGVHRYVLAWQWTRARRRCRSDRAPGRLPVVTVQLPIYNERYVVERLIDAVARLDYPRDRLEIQVLDDSDDDTAEIAEAAVARHRARGLDIVHLRRVGRSGYKAGALAEGLARARGELCAVFDADFVPAPDFLRRVVGEFEDPSVGMVQARWGHLNRDESMLTRTQALMLDGHFVIEHSARAAAGCFFNFNGTAGVWRTECIRSAGGWQADTLTEDLDLSYRAQLAGWRFVYRPDVVVAAEVPAEMAAFKSQQRRWAKGAMQTARKLLPAVLRGPLPLRVKVEAFFHLTASASYLLLALLALLLPATMVLRHRTGLWHPVLAELPVLLLATASVCVFYVLAQREVGDRRPHEIALLMAVGVGLALSNAAAIAGGLFGRRGPFERTPKSGAVGSGRTPGSGYGAARDWMGLGELALAAYLVCGLAYAVSEGIWAAAPFLLLFVAGYLYVGILSIRPERRTATSSGRTGTR